MREATTITNPTRPGSQRFQSTVFILLAALVAVMPLLLRGPSCGDDFGFHLTSWIDAQHGWRSGILYPHWAVDPNYGSGEPRFVFYPPLSWMLGAALGLILPWSYVPAAFTFVVLTATGFAAKALARQLLSESAAILAGCSAIFFGYALYTAYERTAFGELLGGIWIPLILLFALRDRNPDGKLLRRTFDGSTLPLALCIAAAWLSNAPVGVMACYLLAAVALCAAILSKSYAPALRAAVATALGLAFTGFYLLPAAHEQRWVDIRQATSIEGLRIEDNWLFKHHPDSSWWWHDHELQYASLIVVATVLVAIASALIARRRNALPAAQRAWWLPLSLIAPVVILLQLPISQPVWHLLPKLSFLQFPWRWLLAVEAPVALFFAAAVWSFPPLARKIALFTSTLAFIAAVAVANHSFFLRCNQINSVSAVVATIATGKGFSGTPEYSPPGATTTQVSPELPDACLVTDPYYDLFHQSCDRPIASSPVTGNHGVEDLELTTTTTDHPGYLLLRLRRYPTWSIKVNNQPATEETMRKDGLIVVPVPAGAIHLSARWTATSDVLAGRAITCIAILLLLVLAFVERRNRLVHLSS